VTNIENLRDIFAILHDGTIVEWNGDRKFLALKVGCQYLAEKIDTSFEYFYIDLIDIGKIALVPWMNPAELEQEYFVEPRDIFQAELDILSADVENDLVQVSCNQRDSGFDYCGGTLYIDCKDIKIYDEQRNELTIERLDQICKEYWEEFAKR
jgi:hypothetical protein